MAEKVTIVDADHVAQYEDAKRFVMIETCGRCIYQRPGAEEGGELKKNAKGEVPENLVWYYCFHTHFTGFPRRIGQKDKIDVIAPFCPLEGMVDRDRAPKKSVGGGNIPAGLLNKIQPNPEE
jgi:hypothetical protein